MSCYICSQNEVKSIPDDLCILIARHIILSEMVNPGGRELVFRYGGHIHLDEQCDNCDQKKLREFLTKADI